MNQNKIQSDVVVLRSLQMRHLTHCPLTVAISEVGELLIDVRLTLVDPDDLIDRLNADRVELYRRHDCALVPIKWVKTLLADDPSLSRIMAKVERTARRYIRQFPTKRLYYVPVTEVGLRHGH